MTQYYFRKQTTCDLQHLPPESHLISLHRLPLNVIPTFDSVDKISKCSHSKKRSSVLFIMLYNVVQTYKFVNENVKCDHSNESFWAILSHVLFVMDMLNSVVLTYKFEDEILKSDQRGPFLQYSFFCFYTVQDD